MKNTFLHLILFCFLAAPAFSQSGKLTDKPAPEMESRYLPGNPDFPLGLKPAPFKLNHLIRPPGDTRYKSTASEIPMFDLRTEGRVTPVKDQGGGEHGGNCASFATIGALESRWLTMGLSEPDLDLSEQNMAACNGFEWGYGEGANQFMCSAYLTRLAGPVLESEDPYNQVITFCRSDIVEMDPVALIPE